MKIRRLDIMVVLAVLISAVAGPLFAHPYKQDGYIVWGTGYESCPGGQLQCNYQNCGNFEDRMNNCVNGDGVCITGFTVRHYNDGTTCHWSPGGGGDEPGCYCVL